MTDVLIPEDTRQRVYTAAASQVDFAVPFPYDDATEIDVEVEASDGSISNPTFTMVPVGPATTGTLRLDTGLTGGERVVVYGDRANERVTSFAQNTGTPSAKLNSDFVNLQKQVQEAVRILSEAMLARRGESLPRLPAVSALLGNIAYLNAAGTDWATLAATDLQVLADDLSLGASSNIIQLAAIDDDLQVLAALAIEIAALGAIPTELTALYASISQISTVAAAVLDGSIDALVDPINDALTYAEARLLTNLEDGDIIAVRGALASFDGGAGDFIVDASDTTSADDSAVVLVAGSTRLKRLGADEDVQPEWFLSASDGGDDALAFQRAVDFVEARSQVGGKIILSAKRYQWATKPIISRHGIQVIGQGSGNMVNFTPAYNAATEIEINQTTDHGIDIRGMNCRLAHFDMQAESSRRALAFDINKGGIHLEPPDDTNNESRCDRFFLDTVRVSGQPGDGISMVGGVTHSQLKSPEVIDCKGMGIRLDAGGSFGRTNRHYPGLIFIRHPRVGYVGGHAISVADPSVTIQFEMGVRVHIEDLDSYGNASDAAVRYSNHDVWMFAENSSIRRSAVNGSGWDGSVLTPEQHGGIYVAGRDIKLINNRYISTLQPVTVGYISAQPTRGVEVSGIRTVQNSLTILEVVNVESGAEQVHVAADDVNGAHSFLMTAGVPGSTLRDGSALVHEGGNVKLGSVRSIETLTINDDAVAELDFSIVSQATGVLTLAGSAISVGGGIFHFRVGGSPGVAKWAGASNTNIGPSSGSGALTGTSGTDGEITVSAHTDGRLYIENRRGFTITLDAFIGPLVPTATLLAGQ